MDKDNAFIDSIAKGQLQTFILRIATWKIFLCWYVLLTELHKMPTVSVGVRAHHLSLAQIL